MLHEILLSLSGHPSPLLQPLAPTVSGSNHSESGYSAAYTVLTPPERSLLAPLARLADLHARLISHTASLAADHPTTVGRAVAAAVSAGPLAEFQARILAAEEDVLRRDARLVGDGSAVPLTAIVGEFSGWTRRIEWLWSVVIGGYLLGKNGGEGRRQECTGAGLVDLLRAEIVSGYSDIEATARHLVAVAETAWLKQVSAWILYGRIPSLGEDDFFIHKGEDGDFTSHPHLLPSFVTPATASSMLFIGKSLNHIRLDPTLQASLPTSASHVSSQLALLVDLSHPIAPVRFSRAISAIRLSLSRNTLQKLLPLAKVLEALRLFRDFLLLDRGEFAMALVQEADDKMRSRWKRAAGDTAAYERRDGILGAVVVKEGEVATILARTWAALGAMQRQSVDEDEGLELARDLLRLTLLKTGSKPQAPLKLQTTQFPVPLTLSPTPFRNLLLAVPTSLTLRTPIPSPLDMFLGPSEMAVYSAINSYLLAIRRAHIRLTNLWKITTLRRHHPAPPGPPRGSTRTGRAQVLLFRERATERQNAMRDVWVTCSGAVFLLAELEAYLRVEVVGGLWESFYAWLTGGGSGDNGDGDNDKEKKKNNVKRKSEAKSSVSKGDEDDKDDEDDDVWLGPTATARTSTAATRSRKDPTASTSPSSFPSPSPSLSTSPSSHISASAPSPHDPQSLTVAHQTYLAALARNLLLTQPALTDPLYSLLIHVDELVGLVHRLQAIWNAADLEADAGVVDAFADLEKEERDVRGMLRNARRKVRASFGEVVAALRKVEGVEVERGWEWYANSSSGGGGKNPAAAHVWDGDSNEGTRDPEAGGDIVGYVGGYDGVGTMEAGGYVPPRVGSVNRLLMKLDFGAWFDEEGGHRTAKWGLGA